MVKFVPRLTINDPTPMEGNPWWYSSGNPFYTPTLQLPNCTCYAYGRYAEIRGEFNSNLPTGNAKTWYQTAAESGLFSVGQEPRLGAIACYGYPEGESGDWAGHVAVVEVIQQRAGELVVTTSNSYYNGTYFNTWDVTNTQNFTPTWVLAHGGILQGFIYLDVDVVRIEIPVLSAILGNWRAESGLDPEIWESLKDPVEDLGAPDRWTYEFAWVDGVGTGGFGLGQWTNVGTTTGRLYNLHTWVNDLEHFYGDGNGYGQLAYFIDENLWMSKTNQKTNATTLGQFLSLTNTPIEDLVWDFMLCWEGLNPESSQSAMDNYNNRVAYAQVIYRHILLHMTDREEGYTWKSNHNNNYLSVDDTLNNAMVIYFWFKNNYISPIHFDTKKGMPVWMMLDYYFDM